jgi:Tfp pilus assembly protein PilF
MHGVKDVPPSGQMPDLESAGPALSSRHAAMLTVAWSFVMLAISLFGHATALYTVETDLVGEYLPAARELASGVLPPPQRFSFKGPGYPLLIATLAAPLRGDVALAARILSPLAAGLSAWLAFILIRRIMGGPTATFALLAMLAAPMHVRHAIEAGTDSPGLALMLGATVLVVLGRRSPSRLAAGLLAGYAVLTRSNAIFLMPCAIVVLLARREGLRSLLAYGLGAAFPLIVWSWVGARAGGLPSDRNYLNVAWELYGQGVRWDRFEATIGGRFRSLLDVVAYDPVRAAGRVLRNLVVHRVLDLRDLIPPWIGGLALPGLVLLGRDRRCRALLLHAVACASVLATVFYNPRFGLYLLPIYAAAAGATLQRLPTWLEATIRSGGRPGRTSLAMNVLAAGLIASSGVTAAVALRRSLMDAPHETRVAGRALREMRASGGGILARKPHVAWYAGMRFVPMPLDRPLSTLGRWAHDANAQFLFFSGIEQLQRPEWGVLADSGLSLPGYEQVAWGGLPRGHFYSLYRITKVRVDSTRFAAAFRAALERYEARRPGSPNAMLYVAIQYLAIGDPGAARERLERLVRAGARDPAVERYRAIASLATGDLEAAAAACSSAMSLERRTGWHWAHLGTIRTRQHRFEEARDCYQRAVALEPASVEYLEQLGQSRIRTREYARAAADFERWVRLAPTDVRARRFAMGAWQLAGDQARMQRIYEDGVKAGLSPDALLGTDGHQR